jgi:hypothetical protein
MFSSPLRCLSVLALLAATFGLYLQPQFLVMLAEQVWTCF